MPQVRFCGWNSRLRTVINQLCTGMVQPRTFSLPQRSTVRPPVRMNNNNSNNDARAIRGSIMAVLAAITTKRVVAVCSMILYVLGVPLLYTAIIVYGRSQKLFADPKFQATFGFM